MLGAIGRCFTGKTDYADRAFNYQEPRSNATVENLNTLEKALKTKKGKQRLKAELEQWVTEQADLKAQLDACVEKGGLQRLPPEDFAKQSMAQADAYKSAHAQASHETLA